MSRLRLAVPAAVFLLVTMSGCGSARMLGYNAETGVGVVAIPNNYNFWPLKYRDEADKLMAQRCPNGYDIVEEKEVVVGQTATTSSSVEREQPINTRRGPLERTSGSSVTTVSDQTEYRITFRARPAAPPVMMTPPTGGAIAPAGGGRARGGRRRPGGRGAGGGGGDPRGGARGRAGPGGGPAGRGPPRPGGRAAPGLACLTPPSGPAARSAPRRSRP